MAEGRDARGRFTKGNIGKQKGTIHKKTTLIRDAFRKLLTDNLENMGEWLERVGDDNPVKALETMDKFAKYSLPKLQRTEITGEGANPLNPLNQGPNNNITANEETNTIIDKMKTILTTR